jgi:hypothetical protein
MAHMKQTETGVWYLSDDWHIEDVQSVRPDLDEDQCIHVLEIMASDFDANNGINWDVISYTADNLYPTTEENDDD